MVRVHLHAVEREDLVPGIPLKCELEVTLPDRITNEVPNPLGPIVFLQARRSLLDDKIAISTNWLQLIGDGRARRFGPVNEDEFMLMRYDHQNERVPACALPADLLSRQLRGRSQRSILSSSSQMLEKERNQFFPGRIVSLEGPLDIGHILETHLIRTIHYGKRVQPRMEEKVEKVVEARVVIPNK